MLPVNLIPAYVSRDQIYPRYIDPSAPELLAIAETLVGLFQAAEGHTRGQLMASLREFVGESPAFQLQRGLAHLLLSRCTFAVEAPLEPVEWRHQVFLTASLRRRRHQLPSLADSERTAILRDLSQEHGLTASQAVADLYADLQEAQALKVFKPIGAEALLHRYNTALAQGVLVRATRLLIQLDPQSATRYRQLFRFVKFFRLLYRLAGNAEQGFAITLDGPLTLFQSSQRYGLRLAQFLPALLLTQGWRLEAEVLWGKARRERRFRLTPAQGLRSHYADTGLWIPPEVLAFVDRFRSLQTEWSIEPSSELLDLGGCPCIPDFVLVHQGTGRRAFIELFGFWRRSGVEERLVQIQQAGRDDILLAIGKKGRVSEEELDRVEGQPVYYFRGVMTPHPVLQWLDRLINK